MPTFTEQLATILNKRFDIWGLTENVEQIYFEKAVALFADDIPPEVRQFLLDADNGYSPEEIRKWTGVIVQNSVARFVNQVPPGLRWMAGIASGYLEEKLTPLVAYILSWSAPQKNLAMAMESGDDDIRMTIDDLESLPLPPAQKSPGGEKVEDWTPPGLKDTSPEQPAPEI